MKELYDSMRIRGSKIQVIYIKLSYFTYSKEEQGNEILYRHSKYRRDP